MPDKKTNRVMRDRALKAEAENERLKDYNANLQTANTALSEEILEAKTEAYKECIEKVKEEINKHSYGVLHKIVINYKIDNLLKELVGGDIG